MSKETETVSRETTKPITLTLDRGVIAQIVVIALLSLLLIYNFGKSNGTNVISAEVGGIASSAAPDANILPKGIPNIYGKEMGISFDDITTTNPRKADSTINILANLDNTLSLSGEQLKRYIEISSQISCEYCCGAASIIFSNGQAACGCAHSYAMRGLAKYLIKNHGNEFSNDQILEEMGKWKVLFFPGTHIAKAAVLKSKGIELNYINLASNKYRGIESGTASGGSMVGGC